MLSCSISLGSLDNVHVKGKQTRIWKDFLVTKTKGVAGKIPIGKYVSHILACSQNDKAYTLHIQSPNIKEF